jgi:hypothetical protein
MPAVRGAGQRQEGLSKRLNGWLGVPSANNMFREAHEANDSWQLEAPTLWQPPADYSLRCTSMVGLFLQRCRICDSSNIDHLSPFTNFSNSSDIETTLTGPRPACPALVVCCSLCP